MINRIRVSGFRNFLYEEVFDLSKQVNVAGIFGSNGSGKSNLLEVFKLIKILSSGELGQLKNYNYKTVADGMESDLTEVEIDFTNNGIRYIWCVHLSDLIEYEALKIYMSERPSNIFEFELNKGNTFDYSSIDYSNFTYETRNNLKFGVKFKSFEKYMKTYESSQKTVLAHLIEKVSDDSLELYSWLLQHIKDQYVKNDDQNISIIEYFQNYIVGNDESEGGNHSFAGTKMENVKVEISERVKLMNMLTSSYHSDSIKMLVENKYFSDSNVNNAMVLLINAFEFVNKKIVIDTQSSKVQRRFLDGLSIESGKIVRNKLYKELISWLNNADFSIIDLDLRPIAIDATDASEQPYYILYDPIETNFYEVYTRHKSKTLKLRYESMGTIRFLQLISVAMNVLEKGGTFISDEIETSIFGSLIRMLIHSFRVSDAQIIFTSHFVDLLDDALYKHEIYFVNRDFENTAEIVPLSSIQGVKAKDKFKEDFLSGRYIDVPFVER